MFEIIRKHPISSLIGLCFTIIGLAGIPDDIVTWDNWIGGIFNMITPSQGRWLLVGFAVLLIIFYNVFLPYLSQRKEKQRKNIEPKFEILFEQGKEPYLQVDPHKTDADIIYQRKDYLK